MKQQKKWNDTDYNIPKFSYRSAFLIFGMTFILTLLAVWLSGGNRQCIIFTLSASMAVTTGLSRYLIDTDRGFGRGFVLTTGGLFLVCFLILQFVPF